MTKYFDLGKKLNTDLLGKVLFEDQKLRAQDRIRQCEAFINNLHLPSKSVKEGMFVLIYMPNRLRTQ